MARPAVDPVTGRVSAAVAVGTLPAYLQSACYLQLEHDRPTHHTVRAVQQT